jgi:prepilin-type N-terminal cleavage/methylation domain-containing protein
MARTWFARLRGERGFTLIELVVVLAILGLLIALALPNYSGARQTAAKDEARVIGQEWKTLEWGCQMGQQVQGTGQCNNDTAIGFNETNVSNWSFVSGSAGGLAAYGVSGTTTVVRCAAGISNLATGTTYQIFMIVTGTRAGTAYDQFVTQTNSCP